MSVTDVHSGIAAPAGAADRRVGASTTGQCRGVVVERRSGVRLEGVVDGGIGLVLDDDRDAERAVGAPHGTPCQRHGRALVGTATDDLVIGRAVLRGLGEKRGPRDLRHVSSGRNAEGADLNGGWRSEHEVGIGGWVAVDYLFGASEGSGGLVWPPKVVTQLALATEKHNHPCLFCAASASSCLLRLAQLSRVGRPALLWNDTGPRKQPSTLWPSSEQRHWFDEPGPFPSPPSPRRSFVGSAIFRIHGDPFVR